MFDGKNTRRAKVQLLLVHEARGGKRTQCKMGKVEMVGRGVLVASLLSDYSIVLSVMFLVWAADSAGDG